MFEAKNQGHMRKFSLKKSFSKLFFRQYPKEEYIKGLRKFSARFLAFSDKVLSVQKIALSYPGEDMAIFEDLRLRGPKIDFRGQDQILQNVSSRTSPRPRTPLRTPPLVTKQLFGQGGSDNMHSLLMPACYRNRT